MSAEPAATSRVAALKAARQRDSEDKRRRSMAAVATMEAAGMPVTFAGVARAAGVSTWLVYAPGVREHIETARQRQAEAGADRSRPEGGHHGSVGAGLRADLANSRQEIRRLRAEHEKLRLRLRLHLGAEIEGPARAELIARVTDLEAANRRLVAERDARSLEADTSGRRVRELEDELVAARESLRRVIRAENRGR